MKKLFSIILLLASFVVSFFDTNAAVLIAVAPQAVTADYYQNIVSSLDLNQIKYLPELYRRYGDQGAGILDMLMAMGYERTEDVPLIQHFEENWIHQNFKVLSHAAGSAGAAVTLTIHPDSLDTSNRFYPRYNDIVRFPNEVGGQIINVSTSTPSAPTITIVPNDVTKAIPAVVQGQPLAITGNAFSEGSTQPVGRFSGAWKYTNPYQIVKESIGASGTQMTNTSWVKIYKGKELQGYYNKGLMDADQRMKISVQGTWTAQELNTNPLAVDNLNAGAAETTTEGLFPYLRRIGIPWAYSPGTLSVTDFDMIERLMSRQYANRTVCAMLGQDVDIEMENVLVDYLQRPINDAITKEENNKLFGDSPEGAALGVTIGFNYFLKAQRRYALKRNEILNDPQTFGSAGYTYPSKFTFFPMGMNKDKKDSSKKLPALGIVWKGMGSYKRKLESFDLGGAGEGVKTTPVDRRDWYQRSEFAAEFFGGNQMVDGYAQ